MQDLIDFNIYLFNLMLMNNQEFILYHYPICPISRSIRFILQEFEIEFNAIVEKFWEKREKFLQLNQTGQVPFLIIRQKDLKKDLLLHSYDVILYAFENFITNSLIEKEIYQKLEIKKMESIINNYFYKTVGSLILEERIYSWYKFNRKPDNVLLDIARSNLSKFSLFFNNIFEKRNFLVGDSITTADFNLCAHLSTLEYLGELDFSQSPALKNFYLFMKSRPSFRNILLDSIPGFQPSKTYRELDY
jgi:glutathione S-transferase